MASRCQKEKDLCHQIILETPQGAANIKVYGLDVNAAETLEAQKILDMQRATDPVQLEDGTGLFDENNFLSHTDASGPIAQIRMDILNRVSQAEPEFFDDFIQSLRRVDDRGIGLPGTHRIPNDPISILDFAWNSSKLDVSNLFGADRVALERFQQMDLQDKVRFLAWRANIKRGFPDVGPDGRMVKPYIPSDLQLNSSFVADLNEYHMKGDPNFASSGDLADHQRQVQFAENDLISTLMDTESFRDSVEISDVLFDGGRTKLREGKPSGLSGAGVPEFWHLQPTAATELPPWERMIRIYQRSLSADGYTATAWFNDMDVSTNQGTFPNVLLSNPMAAVPADVRWTSQNIGKIWDPLAPGNEAFMDPKLRTLMDPQAVIDQIERRTLNELTPTRAGRQEAIDALEVLYGARETLMFDTPMLLRQVEDTFAQWGAALRRISPGRRRPLLDAIRGETWTEAQVAAKEAFDVADAELVKVALARQALNERQVVATEARNLLENLEGVGALAEKTGTDFSDAVTSPVRRVGEEDLVSTLKVLLEADDQELRFALKEFQLGSADWWAALQGRGQRTLWRP